MPPMIFHGNRCSFGPTYLEVGEKLSVFTLEQAGETCVYRLIKVRNGTGVTETSMTMHFGYDEKFYSAFIK